MKILFSFCCLIFHIACNNNKTLAVDTIFYNGKVYSCNDSFIIHEAFAIKDHKFIAVGKSKDILAKYNATEKIDLKNKTVYPGFFDAHCHFYALGKLKSELDLSNINSWQKIVDSVAAYIKLYPNKQWIVGRGWDHTLFADKKMPSFNEINALFPTKYILLRRVDGHAAIANSNALQLANINAQTQIAGGEIGISNGKLNGLLLDNAVELITQKIPDPSIAQKVAYLLTAQKLCLAAGLSSIVDAGLGVDMIELIDSLYKTGQLKIRINAMLSANQSALDYAKNHGPIETDYYRVKSFKVYTDGALGSRGALLKSSYCDRKGHHGLLLTPIDTIKKYCEYAAQNHWQVNAHAIGDSANGLILNLFGNYTKNKDLRWRIEHAQVVSMLDMPLFKTYSIIPSVQPTHATSDMRWANERICNHCNDNQYYWCSAKCVQQNENSMCLLGFNFQVANEQRHHL